MSLYLGIAAASFGLVMASAPLFQIRLILRRRSSEGVSLTNAAVLLLGSVLWCSYGVSIGSLTLIAPNALAVAVNASWVAAVLRFRQHLPVQPETPTEPALAP